MVVRWKGLRELGGLPTIALFPNGGSRVSTIALELIAAMLKTGDIGPIHRGEFRREHCTDTGSEHLFDFLSRYRQISQGQGHVPALSVVRDRFPHLLLPETAEIIDLPGLVYEARSYKTRLRIQTLASKMVSAIEAIDPVAELRAVRNEFDDVMKDAASSRDLNFMDAALEILDDYSQKQILKEGIPWPWAALHEATQGIHAGEFYIIAGRPKSRKTFIALYVAAYLVRFFKMRILFISPEMPARQVMLRFIAFLAEVHYSPFKRGMLVSYEEDSLYANVVGMLDSMQGTLVPGVVHGANDDLAGYSEPSNSMAPGSEGAFVVAKATSQPVTFIEAKIQEHKPHVVIVDSFYRLGMAGGSKTYDSDWKVITSVSRMLKDMAMTHEVGLIGTHQLNRDADEKIGGLANLGYADAIGQDCDMALRVITARRKMGDKSALIVLGARETDVEGVLIHNVPCSDFSQIEPLIPGNRKKLLAMMTEEDAENDVPAEATRSASNGHPPGYVEGKRAAPVAGRKKKRASDGLPTAGHLVAPMSPEELLAQKQEEQDSEEDE